MKNVGNFSTKKVGDRGLAQSENDFWTGGIFYGLILASKVASCLTFKQYGVISKRKLLRDLVMLREGLKKEINLIQKMGKSNRNVSTKLEQFF